MKNNKELMASFYYTKGFISLFLIGLILGFTVFQLFSAHDSRDEILKHKIDVELEKKLYY
tara:strand:- start:222 stop:401 length:180 start_codon:yes stop_codon:yes gene_type:complete